jgi:hypothetical protein
MSGPGMPDEDPAPRMHDARTQSADDYDFRRSLAEYWERSPGPPVEKLENFAKYVPRQNLARFLARYEIFKLIQGVQGSIVECGVMLGGGLFSFAKLSAMLEPYNFQRRVYGFDTFEGFPEIHESDRAGRSDRHSTHMVEGGFAVEGAYEDVLAAIDVFDRNRFLNHFPKVEVVRGRFEDTIDAFLAERPHLVVSCLYLDFDIYAPTVAAIRAFRHRMPRGAVIAFDELNDESFPGETAAVFEELDITTLRVRRFDFDPRISYVVLGD